MLFNYIVKDFSSRIFIFYVEFLNVNKMYIFVHFLLKYLNNVVTGKDIYYVKTSLDRDFSKMHS